ncbi:MAG: hypothetical protein M3436_18295 [Pseudomonadota bacterium]|nr:hypothetical protein [Pseudomonadota bacterium]
MDWIDTLDPEHLEAYDLRPPERTPDLVKRFRHCRLVRRQGRTLHFDNNACALLVRSLRRPGGGAAGAAGAGDDTADLLAQAHCFWAIRLSKGLRASDGRVPLALRDGAHGVAAKEAAYHWSRLEPAAVASPAVHWRDPDGLWEEAARVLMLAAAALRVEGVFEAGKLASLDAAKWAARLVGDRRNEVEAAVVGELWAVYLATWSHGTWQRLSILAKERPDLTGGDVWVVYERYRAFLTGDSVAPPASVQDTASPWLVNLKRLGDVLLEARQKEGFVEVALGDVAWALPEPVSPPDAAWPALALCELHALAALERNDAEAEETALRRWRAHLEAAALDPLWIADQMSLEYRTARYEHVVLSAARRFCPDADPDRGRKWLALHAEPADEDSGAAMNLLERARERYSSVSATAALLGMRPILAQVSFHLGELLREHTPNAKRKADPEWWRGWENMFAACLRIERGLGWRFHEPAIHTIRWEFFKAFDQPTSVNDAYNAYLAVKSCGFPTRVVLDWHSHASSILNDYGDRLEHHQWSAELHEAWARSLAALPEAEPYRYFKRSLPLERSRALVFAAQARRVAKEYEVARRLLDEADGLCGCEVPGGPNSDDGEDPQLVRNHLLNLRLQRIWLQSTLERRAPLFRVEDAEPSRLSDELILALWRDLQRTDEIVALVLGGLVNVELRQRHAADA